MDGKGERVAEIIGKGIEVELWWVLICRFNNHLLIYPLLHYFAHTNIQCKSIWVPRPVSGTVG